MENISILGSTGSIGVQTLDVVRQTKRFKINSLSAKSNVDLLEKQALEFRPKVVAVIDKDKYKILKEKLKIYNIKVVTGIEGLIEVACISDTETVINSVVGMVGLLPTLEAIRAKKKIALANKETLVTAGEIVMKEAKENNVNIIPIDSEHSAIFQCLMCGTKSEISKLILTASGGPFRGKKVNDLKNVKVKDALNHPNWSMGKKLTVDSATLMNKGLEVIEAKWLFDVDIDNIEVVIHPQSIIHSMVEYIDGSIIAQMGIPDMRIPIQYALTYPERIKNQLKRLDLVNLGQLTFEKPDNIVFPCLSFAFEAIKIGGTMTAVLNAANEIAVELFLNNKIRFLDIPEVIDKIMKKHLVIKEPTLEEILMSDEWARNEVKNIILD